MGGPSESQPRKPKNLNQVYTTCNFVTVEPESYEEVAKYKEWIKATMEEMSMIKKNDNWDLVDPPKYRKIMKLKCIYRAKLKQD